MCVKGLWKQRLKIGSKAMKFIQRCMDPRGHVEGKFIAIVTTVALVFTMCNVAVFAAIGSNDDNKQVESAQAGDDTSDKSEVKADTPDEAVVSLSAGNGYITYGGQTLDGKTSSFKAKYAESLTFKASANEGYKLTGVKASSGGSSKTLGTGEGTYTVPASMVTNDLKITLESEADESAKDADNAATPIDGDDQSESDDSKATDADTNGDSKADGSKTDADTDAENAGSKTDTDNGSASKADEKADSKTDADDNKTDGSSSKKDSDASDTTGISKKEDAGSGNTDATVIDNSGNVSDGDNNAAQNSDATDSEDAESGDDSNSDSGSVFDAIGGFFSGLFGGSAETTAETGIATVAETTADYTVAVGDTVTITGTSGYSHSWASSSTDVATVTSKDGSDWWSTSSTGTVKAVSAGTVTISHIYYVYGRYGSWTENTETFTVKVVDPTPATAISISGDDTVTQFATTTLSATLTPSDAAGGTVAWSSDNTEILTVSNTGVVTGARQGTANVTATYTNADGTTVSASKQITVAASSTSTGNALVYYLVDPTLDATSNSSSNWGEISGTATINTTNATWTNGKNCFDNVDQRIISWPDNTNVIKRGSDTWNAVFEKYKEHLKEDLGVDNFTEDDIEEMTLVPAKISKNNGTSPDYHVDCNVNVKCKNVALVKYYVRDAGSTSYDFKGSKNYFAGDETSPSDVTNEAFPESKTKDGVTYTFSGWYADANFTQPVTFPYKVSESTTFYAKYIGGFQVKYDLGGGSWDTGDSTTYVVQEGGTHTVKQEPAREGYKFTGWTITGVDGKTTVTSGETFTMPAGNVTITANWEELTPYEVKFQEFGTDNLVSPTLTHYGEMGKDVLEVAADASASGYQLISWCPSTVTKTLGEGDNTIIFWYEKSSVNYTVNYYVNGTEVKAADSEVKSAKWDSTVTVSDVAKSIDGYTLVPDQTASITVNRDGSSTINVYYYKNTTLTANSSEVTYNGQEQSVTGYTCSDAEASFSNIELTGGKGTNAGTYPYEFADGTVGTVSDDAKYIVTEANNGQLKINPVADAITVKVKGNTATETYDGTQKTASGYTVSIEGSDLYKESDITFSGSAVAQGTNAGTYDMKLSKDQFSNNNTANFTNVTFVIESDGELTVNPRDLTLVSADLSKEYDGKALTNGSTALKTEQGWVDGEGATYTFTGSQTAVGTSANSFTYAAKSGTNLNNYNISKNEGALEVKDRTTKFTATVTANSGQGTYNGTEQSVSGVTGTTVTIDGVTFTITGLSANATGTDAGTYDSVITGGAVVTDPTGNDVTSQFDITKVNGKLEIAKANVKLESDSLSKEYDGEDLVNGDTALKTNSGWVNGQGVTVTFTGAQNVPGVSDNSFTYTANEGTNLDNYNISSIFGSLTVTSRGATKELTVEALSDTVTYDGNEHTVSGLKGEKTAADGTKYVEFTVDGKTYTVTGLSTYGATGKDVVVNSDGTVGAYANNIYGTPVVKDSKGNDVTSEFKVNTSNGTLTINKADVELKSADLSKNYDGTPLVNGDTALATQTGFVDGEGITCTFTGSQLNAGSSANSFTYAANEGTNLNNYNITKTEGTLTVNKSDAKVTVVITEKSGSAKYDGTEHTVTGYTVTSISDELYTADDFSFSGDATITGKNAGSYDMKLKASDFKNISSNFKDENVTFQIVDGTLEIAKRDVTIASASDSKTYDGTPLVRHDVSIGGDKFVDGEGITYDVTGTITNAGSTPNAFTYDLTDATNPDNYNITKTEGMLTVNPVTAHIVVTITGDTEKVTYDGEKHTAKGYTVSIEGSDLYTESLIKFTGTSEVTKTDAGNYKMGLDKAQFANTDTTNFTDVTFVVVDGELDIAKRSVTIKSQDLKKDWDGTPLTNGSAPLEKNEGWVNGQGVDVNFTGSQTAVGTSANSFTYTAKNGTDLNNYNITKTEGNLTVSNRSAAYKITVEANSAEFKYDGSEKTASGIKTDTFEVNGNLYKVSGLTTSDPEYKNAGEYTNSISGTAVVTDANGNDVTSQFDVSFTSGTLKIDKREVTLTSATDSKTYDGTPLTNSDVAVGGDGWADGEGAAYTVTGTITNAGSVSNAFGYELNGNTSKDNYTITKTQGTLTVNPVTDEVTVTITGHGNTVNYDGKEHSVSGYDFSASNSAYTQDKASFGGSAEAKGTDVGTYAMDLDKELFDNKDTVNFTNVTFVVYDGLLQINPVAIDASAVTWVKSDDSKKYDAAPLAVSAATATDKYGNALTVEYSLDGENWTTDPATLSITHVSESTTVQMRATSDNYKDADGNPSYATATKAITVTKRNVTLTSASDTKVYDGTALTNNAVTPSVDGWAAGEGATYTVTGTQTEVGSSDNAFSYELNGNTSANDYEISLKYGQLTVTELGGIVVKVKGKNDSVTYDAKSHTVTGYEVVSISDSKYKASDFAYKGSANEPSATGTAVGTYNMGLTAANFVNSNKNFKDVTFEVVDGSLEITPADISKLNITAPDDVTYNGNPQAQKPKITDADGNELKEGVDYELVFSTDTTNAGTVTVTINGKGNYNNSSTTVTYKINKRVVNLKSESANKAFDGTPLTKPTVTGWEQSGDTGFVTGEVTDVKATGSVTYVTEGTVANTITYTETSSFNAGNYTIKKDEGELYITKSPIAGNVTLSTTDVEVTYDGKSHIAGTAGASDKNNTALTIEYSIDGKDWTTNPATISAKDVADSTTVKVRVSGKNYDGYVTGDQTLTINKREVKLVSQSGSKTYDGTPLTKPTVTGWEQSGDTGFVTSEVTDVKATGSVTKVSDGVVDNTIVYTENDGFKAGNYKISKAEGTLQITANGSLTVQDPDNVKYDGTSHEWEPEVKDSSGKVLEKGKDYVVSYEGDTTNVTDAGVKVTITGIGDYTGTVEKTFYILPREVTLTSATASKTYDGMPLANHDVTVGGDGWADGEGAAYTVTGTITNAGTVDNAFTYELSAGTHAKNYRITTADGTLTVNPVTDKVTVTITGMNSTEAFDGKKHTVSGYTASYSNGAYNANKYSFNGTATASRTDVGTTVMGLENTQFANTDTKNFTNVEFVIAQDGWIEITPVAIDASAVIWVKSDDSKKYDAAALAVSAATATDKYGNALTVEYSLDGGNWTTDPAALSITHVSESTTVQMRATSDNYKDADGNPSYATATKAITVTKRNVTLTSANAGKVYDGTALTKDDVSVGGDTFASGEGADFDVTGTQTEVGSSDNTFSYTLWDGTDANDYTITPSCGKLTVSEADGVVVTIKGGYASYEYDTKSHTVTGYEVVKIDDKTGKYKSSDFAYKGAEGVTEPSATGTAVGTYYMGLTDASFVNNNGNFKNVTFVVEDGSLDIYSANIQQDGIITVGTLPDITYDGQTHAQKPVVKDKRSNEELVEGVDYTVSFSNDVTNAGTVTVTITGMGNYEGTTTVSYKILPKEYAVTTYDASKTYDGAPLTAGGRVDGLVSSSDATFKVTGTQTAVGSSSNTYKLDFSSSTMAGNYKLKSEKLGTLTVTETTAQITVTTTGGTFTYDGQSHAATVRVTGVPAGYTVEVASSSAKATHVGDGEVKATADTLVIKNAQGEDVTSKLKDNIVYKNDTIKINPATLTMVTPDATKVYDGTALTKDGSISGFVNGETATFTTTGTQTNVGNSKNSYSITWDGSAVESDYAVSATVGTLTVTKDQNINATVEITGDGWKYDGTFHKDDVKASSPSEADGATPTYMYYKHEGNDWVKLTGEPKDAGDYAVRVIWPETDNYKELIAEAPFTIAKRSVTLTSATDEKAYDKTPLTNKTVTASGDGFIEGEGYTPDVTGTITNIGTATNTFSYTLNDGTKASNYAITKVYGQLTVTNAKAKYDVTVTGNSGEFTYDGTKHEVSGAKTYEFTIDGETYTVSGLKTSDPSATDAGTYTNNVTGTPKVTDSQGKDVTDKFAVHTQPGTLAINKRAVVITSGSAQSSDPATTLTNSDITISGEGFVKGEGATYDITGAQKGIGSSSNTFAYTLNDGTKASNYTITTEFGTLTVYPAAATTTEITLTGNSDTVTYDGTKHGVSGVVGEKTAEDGSKYVVVTVNGKDYTVTGYTTSDPEATNAGSYNNNITGNFKVTDSDGNDVTDQFKINVEPGTLTVAKRVVTLVSGSKSVSSADAPLQFEDGTALTVGGEGFVNGEGVTHHYTGVQTNPGTSQNTFTYVANDGTNLDNYSISTEYGTLNVYNAKAQWTVDLTANSGTYTYNGTARTVDGFASLTIDGAALTDNGDGTYSIDLWDADYETKVDDETSKGATRTFVISGLSVTGANGTDAGSYVNAVDLTNVKVTVDGKDVTSEFGFKTTSGTLTINPADVTLASDSYKAEYDGAAHTVPNVTVTADEVDGVDIAELFKSQASAKANGTVTHVSDGVVSNGIVITPASGYKATNYNITKSEGTLEVTPVTAEVTVTINGTNATYYYDGAAHNNQQALNGDTAKQVGYTDSFSSDIFNDACYSFTWAGTQGEGDQSSANALSGIAAKQAASVSATNVNRADAEAEVGTYGMGLTADNFSNTSADFSNVKFNVTDGALTINPRVVELTSATDAKVYDATPLTNSDVTATEYNGAQPADEEAKGFVSGEGFTADVTGSQTLVGSSDNAFTYELSAGTHAKNYRITTADGTLTVTDSGDVPVPDGLVVSKTHADPANAATFGLNDTVTFTISVKNIYDEPKTITVTDENAEFSAATGDDRHSVTADFAAGETKTFTATHVVTEQDLANQEIVNVAKMTVTNGDTTKTWEATDTVKDNELADVNPSMTVDKQPAANAPTNPNVGAEVPYTITVTNNGNVTLKNIEVTDGLQAASIAEGDGYTVTGNKAIIAELAPGSTVTVSATYTVTEADIIAGKIVNTAKATTEYTNPKTGDTTTVTKTDESEKNVASAAPSMKITKTDGLPEGTTVNAGDVITYTVTVENTGNLELTNIVLTDQLNGAKPKQGEGYSINSDRKVVIVSLARNAKVTATYTYTVKQSDVDKGQVENVVTGTASNGSETDTTVIDGKEVTPGAAQKPSLSVKKEATSTAPEGGYKIGDKITYSITVTNNGNVTVSGIHLNDSKVNLRTAELLDGVQYTDINNFSLGPNEAKSFRYTYTVTAADMKAGEVENKFVATGEDPNGGSVIKTDSATTKTATPNAQLTVEKKASVTQNAKVGDVINYTIKVTNTGNLDVSNFKVVDQLEGAAIQAGAGYTVEDGKAVVESLKIGESIDVAATYTVQEKDVLAGKVVNTATTEGGTTATDTDPTPKPGDAITNTEDIDTSMTVKKTIDDPKDSYDVGDVITYSIVVSNKGNVAFHNVVVKDALDGAIVAKGEGYTVNDDGTATIGTLAADTSVTVKASYTVTKADVTADAAVSNKATAKADAMPDPHSPDKPATPEGEDTNTDANTPAKPGLTVTKSIKGEQKASYALGDVITYTVTVKNSGNVDLTDVVLTDELAAAQITGGTDNTVKIGDMKSGAIKSYDVTYKVTEQDIRNGSVTNTATATGKFKDEETTGKSDGVKTGTDQMKPAVTVSKEVTSTAPEGGYGLGSTISYKLTVANNGNVTLYNVNVSDALADFDGKGSTSTVIDSLAPGAAKEITYDYTVTSDDILAGKVTNAATATGSSSQDDPTKGDATDKTSIDTNTADINTSMSMVKTVSSTTPEGGYKAGDTIAYDIKVTNNGNVPYPNVVVKDTLNGAAIVSGDGYALNSDGTATIESLAVGATVTVKAEYVVTENDMAAGFVTNAAVANGDEIVDPHNPDKPKTPEANDETTTPDGDVTKADPKLTVSKTVDGTDADNDGKYALGETITYAVTVTNNGNVTAGDVSITDNLPGAQKVDGDTYDGITLKVGESATAHFTYTVTEADILNGSITNTATATGNSPAPTTDPDKPQHITPGTGDKTTPVDESNPHMTVNKTTTSTPADGALYQEGETITYQVVVTNDGNLTITGAKVQDQLAGAVLVSGSEDLGEFKPGDTATLTYSYKVTEADLVKGKVVNDATVTGGTNGTEGTDNPKDTTVNPGTVTDDTYQCNSPSMVITKTADASGNVKAGDTITYNVKVRNNGDCTLTNVKVTDALTGDNWTIGTLAKGAEQTFTTSYTVTYNDMKAGKVTNIATGSADNPTGSKTNVTPGEVTTTTDKYNASWTVKKTVTSTPANGSFYKSGEKIAYQIVVTNAGNVPLSNIKLKDSLVDLGTQGTIATLNAGESKTITYSYTVTDADAKAGKVTNSVTGTANTPTNDSTDDSDKVKSNTGNASNGGNNNGGTDANNNGGGNGGNNGAIDNGGDNGNVTPVAPVTPDSTDTPSGEQVIDDNQTPLAPGDGDTDCWVHWWMFVCLLLTLVYGGVVIIRRNGNSRKLQEQQDELLKKDEEEQK